RLREVGALDRVVGDREVDARELRRDLSERRGEQVAGRRDEVRALTDGRRQVRQVVRARVRLERDRLHAELVLRQGEAGELVLVERLVVELADVADQGWGEGRLGRRRRGDASADDPERKEQGGSCRNEQWSFHKPSSEKDFRR